MSIDGPRETLPVTPATEVWRGQESFQDALYEWMQRTPWLAISGAAHLVLLLILQAFPWALFERPEEVEITSSIAMVTEPLPEPPPPELDQKIETEIVDQVPVIQELPTDFIESDDFSETPSLEPVGDAGALADSPFMDVGVLGELGLGGPPGGKYTGRFGPAGTGGRDGRGTAPSMEAGLRWLAEHQERDGRWDCDGFMAHDPVGDLCTGPGGSLHDVGVSGLALLSFLGDGNTTSRGPYRNTVKRGIRWLQSQQDPDTGLIGDAVGKGYLYDHAIASLALCEAYYFSSSPLLKHTVQKALNQISRARNPYGAWRYDVPPIGENDTSVTGWMVIALQSGRDAGLMVDEDALVGALAWIDEVTDPGTGRVGYDSIGSPSARERGINDHFPTDRAEAMTAVGLLSRVFLGQTPDEHPIMRKHAELMLKSLPRWDADGLGSDMYYWYYGSYAMFQMGGRYWRAWNKAMKSAVLDSQRKDGAHRGSWDPAGPWGKQGGRVYSTAMMVLCLEVYFRYSRVIGGR
jgi:hypothetical protein